MIYKNNYAVWKAKLEFEMTDMVIADIMEQHKVMIIVSDDYLYISVLGTAPKTNTLRDDITMDYKIDHNEFENLWNNLEQITKEKKDTKKQVKNITFMSSHIESFDKLEINEHSLEFDTVKLSKDEKALDTLGIPIKIVSAITDRPLTNMFVSIEECAKFVISGN
jgi:DNA repair ATPase RecN